MKDEEIDRMAEFEENYWWFIGRKKIIGTIIEKHVKLKQNLRILDAGCGSGNTTLELKKFGNVYGIDFSFSALRYAKNRGINKVVQSSSYDLPFLSNTFDVITILDVLEHIEDDSRVLKELKRILKQDGIILITVPAFQFLWSDHDTALSHFRRYNHKNLHKIVTQSGLTSTRLTYFISCLFPILALYRILSTFKKKKLNPKPTLIQLPSIVNNILKQMLYFENKILQAINMPFGLSLFCVAKINVDKKIN
jgi:2-polyprenyl-3-methyl-5-hydroxy-6-metoxy-1,4-benzoquinol methylase